MPNKPTDKQIDISMALAYRAVECLEDPVNNQIEVMKDYLQLLADSNLIDPEDGETYITTAIHAAVDSILDADSEEAEETKQESCCNK